MNKFRFTINAVAIAIFMFAFASLAQAQATRTWVSGVGDDVNPCSRTAPCKTFAGAISKTADNGEIDCLDPGGFGVVTITKSIVLDGGGTLGSILGGGSPSCLIINDSGSGSPNSKTVTLRRLSINGSGGVNPQSNVGVNIVSALRVNIQNCYIYNVSQQGVLDSRTGAGDKLSIVNSTIHNIGLDGIHVGPTAAGSSNTTVQIDGCEISSSAQDGIFIKGGATAAIRTTNASLGAVGIQIDSGASAVIMSCNFSGNATGIDNTGGTTLLSDVTVAFCATGVAIPNGSVTGFSNNNISNNTAGNSLSGSILQH